MRKYIVFPVSLPPSQAYLPTFIFHLFFAKHLAASLSAFFICFSSAKLLAKLLLLYASAVAQLNLLRSAILIFFWQVEVSFEPLLSSSWTVSKSLAVAGLTDPLSIFVSSSFAISMWWTMVWLKWNRFCFPNLNCNPLLIKVLDHLLCRFCLGIHRCSLKISQLLLGAFLSFSKFLKKFGNC